ncbi:rhodanese-like domain-containing protein [Alkalimarinus alittae]|uniref:Rhodanese-like domain-containing protein n=1 Tax=Alkalimarinus alittae TaxID=2961619 RepID=A0ABY6MXM3_9ALTE|nr:rhodanese-like domain-containing protein [Alkalimarinus alittae]UZE94587.1 rhodanese-like domain-containing protein [Alkalimarinus alittae]
MNLKKYSWVFLLLIATGFSTMTHAETAWIDVRSEQEHLVDNIEGDVRILHGDIIAEVSEMFPDKSTEIVLYCRSGNRAGKALSALKSAGYTNVSNAGSIGDARRIRGMVE